MLAWLRCTLRGRHNPARQLVGGFRCRDCGAAGADLEEMGFGEVSCAPVTRRALERVAPRD